MTPQRKTQIAISGIAVVFVAVHLVWPEIEIDATTLTLLAAAAVPWLLPLFKTVELPGGLKVEFRELQAAEQRAEEAGLLAEYSRPGPGSGVLVPGRCRTGMRTWLSWGCESRSKDGWRVWLRLRGQAARGWAWVACFDR